MRRLSQKEAVLIGKVIAFLKENPLSTSDEIFHATGVGVMMCIGFIRPKQYQGRTVWRLNHPKLRKEGLI